jgi:hypothetical protein
LTFITCEKRCVQKIFDSYLYNIAITFLSIGPKRSRERTTGPRKMLPARTLQCNNSQ